jgi:outer membrane protein assembly factor BamA
MKKLRKYLFFLGVLLYSSLHVNGQSMGPNVGDSIAKTYSKFIVGKIYTEGNNKTKQEIIFRELPFKSGQEYSLQELADKFETAKKLLMNTMLFHNVYVSACSFDDNKVDVEVTVIERWYLFPLPYLKPIDRNLNQWLVEQKASLDRVDYGIKLMSYNATGSNDNLRLWLITGYSHQLALSYERPYIDKAMKWGVGFGIMTGKEHELNYNTIDNKQAFLKSNSRYLHKSFHANIDVSYRNAIRTRHGFGIGYHEEQINDTVLLVNANYFKGGEKQISFPELHYTFNYQNVDYIAYPTKGFTARVLISKRGITPRTSLWELQVRGFGSWHLSNKTYFSSQVSAGIKLPFRQSFYSTRFLGYGDNFMSGYEYYVVDGVAGGYLRTTLTQDLFGFSIRLPNKSGKGLAHIPFHFYGRIFENSGYVHNPNSSANSLSNKFLHAGGVGIDLITIYDFTLRFEYTFNQLGQNGLFLHPKMIF